MTDYNTEATAGISVGQTRDGSPSLEPQHNAVNDNGITPGIIYGGVPLECLVDAGIQWSLTVQQGGGSGSIIRTVPRLVRVVT